MKNILRFTGMVGLLAVLIISCSPPAELYRIYDTEEERYISSRRLASVLAGYDVVIFGEHRGHNTIHQLQAEILPKYLDEAGYVAISMDIFSRDVQVVIDDYFSDLITEDEFIRRSRAIHTYKIDYRPLVEFAKEEGLALIASNAPRRIVKKIEQYGEHWIETMPPDERFLIANNISIPEDEYRDRFSQIMVEQSKVISLDPEGLSDEIDRLFAAQSAMDDTMAESIVRYLSRNLDMKIMHFNKVLHSDRRMGVVRKIKQRNPELSIAVVTPILKEEVTRRISIDPYRDRGDYIILVEE